MTEQEFFDALQSYQSTWGDVFQIEPDGCLRSEERHCPIIAVAIDAGVADPDSPPLSSEAIEVGTERLWLPEDFVHVVMNAADNVIRKGVVFASMRQRLLTALGLPQEEPKHA